LLATPMYGAFIWVIVSLFNIQLGPLRW